MLSLLNVHCLSKDFFFFFFFVLVAEFLNQLTPPTPGKGWDIFFPSSYVKHLISQDNFCGYLIDSIYIWLCKTAQAFCSELYVEFREGDTVIITLYFESPFQGKGWPQDLEAQEHSPQNTRLSRLPLCKCRPHFGGQWQPDPKFWVFLFHKFMPIINQNYFRLFFVLSCFIIIVWGILFRPAGEGDQRKNPWILSENKTRVTRD